METKEKPAVDTSETPVKELDLTGVKTASKLLHELFIEGDPKRELDLEQARLEADVAGALYQLRTAAGLSQAELAKRVGTTQSVISRLEDADYEGHSLAMLRRIAAAVQRRVEIRFVPRKRRLQPA